MFLACEVLNENIIERSSASLWSDFVRAVNDDQSDILTQCLSLLNSSDSQKQQTKTLAIDLITQARCQNHSLKTLDALLLEYPLNNEEGITLICLAESLLRIPDPTTADALIRDKLSSADWITHLNHADSFWVNASTWGLLLGSKLVTPPAGSEHGNPPALQAVLSLINKFSEALIRKITYQMMGLLAKQFVFAQDIKNAAKQAHKPSLPGLSYTFDMLGESALTTADAENYYEKYQQAIEFVGQQGKISKTAASSVSIKLSALDPCYESRYQEAVFTELFNRLLKLLKLAKKLAVPITIDAEEADRLEISLILFEKLYQHPSLQGWGQLGLVVQSYLKRSIHVLLWLAALAKKQGDKIPVRLVKGAYWDSEIKQCQQRGLSSYPVFTRKQSTDVSYLACSVFLLKPFIEGLLSTQFATHNGQTIAAVLSISGHRDYEFQRLFGMGESLYQILLERYQQKVRIYAPIGNYHDLLPYLLRRLLENGSNNSFVSQLADPNYSLDKLTEHPVDLLNHFKSVSHPNIPLPENLFANKRDNSLGLNINNEFERNDFYQQIAAFICFKWHAKPQITAAVIDLQKQAVFAPFDHNLEIGDVKWMRTEQITAAITDAQSAFAAWNNRPVTERCLCLTNLADLLQENRAELVALCILEAGKTIQDALDEVREAIDFCRYYASCALSDWPVKAAQMFGDQEKDYQRTALGVFACISPWNFPLAIFVGQISAALVTGNTVIAKPAPQTSLIAYRVIELLYQAGFPKQVVQCLPGDSKIGSTIINDPRIRGVVFTGSINSARLINQTLADRSSDPAILIAETGGQNAMIVDSSAQAEQVVNDVCTSAFSSAGQRCSALRVLFVQQEIAEKIIRLIKGKMENLHIGDPRLLKTDIGPVIDQASVNKLTAHCQELESKQQLLYQVPFIEEKNISSATFIAPALFEINHINELEDEYFGPLLHVIRYKSANINQVIQSINETGFALTLGIHSRNQTFISHIITHSKAGNCYINRNQIGAQVGVQPFGGNGLSGTGPKAGGPNYLTRFTCIKTVS